jgi:hypothetical protein
MSLRAARVVVCRGPREYTWCAGCSARRIEAERAAHAHGATRPEELWPAGCRWARRRTLDSAITPHAIGDGSTDTGAGSAHALAANIGWSWTSC